MVSRVRTTAADLDATVREVRCLLRERGFTRCAWYVGPSAQPVGLQPRLLDLGLVPADRPPFESTFTAMIVTREPSTSIVGSGVEARRVRDRDEYVRAFRAGFQAAGVSDKEIDESIDACLAGWDHPSGITRMTHVALVDGVVAGLGMVNYGPSAHFLCGAAVVPAFRGRGVYRALVASRWRDAVDSDKPALAVQAGAMSRPILRRCGFEEVCTVDVLLDFRLA
jgi:GNAT superfamily N-acetyltransferase